MHTYTKKETVFRPSYALLFSVNFKLEKRQKTSRWLIKKNQLNCVYLFKLKKKPNVYIAAGPFPEY